MKFPFARDSRFDVIVDFVFEAGVLFVVIENISASPVFDIKTTFDKKISGPEEKSVINELALFTQLAFLAPGRQIRTLLDTSRGFFGKHKFTEINVTITHKDVDGRHHKTSIRHNLAIYKDIRFVVEE